MSNNETISAQEKAWLKKVGAKLERLILAAGYVSPYDFWINKAGDLVSRASINNLIIGNKDFRITTLKRLAKLLNVPLSELLDVD